MALTFNLNNQPKLNPFQQRAADQIQGKPDSVAAATQAKTLQTFPNMRFGATGSWDAPAATGGAPAPQQDQTPPVTPDYVGQNGGGGGGGYSAPVYQDTSAARKATQQGIDSLDTTLSSNLQSISDNYARIIQQYNDEATTNKTNYDTQVGSNEQTRENTIQAALLAAAQGGRGLRATLGSIGALNGTGLLLANRAVAAGANTDIGDGNKVFDKNATQLYTAYAQTQQDEKNRRAEAEAAKVNEEKATRAAVAKEKQGLYEKMAGFWTDAGNNGEANRYLGMVGNMSPEIAGYSGTAVAPYTPRSVLFNPGELGSYLAGAKDMTVKTGGTAADKAPINSPLYTSSRKREELA